MAFVNEIISEADQEMLKSYKFANPVTGEPVVPKRWTVDRERDIFLIGLGGRGAYVSEIPMFYTLVWKGKRIGLQTYRDAKGDYQSGTELWWKITKINVPESLKPQEKMLIELIKEVIDAYGSANKRDHVTKENFDLIAAPTYVKDVQ